MTKEELEKEAEEYAIGLFPNDEFKQSAVIQGIIKFTEPREKQIEELEKKNKKLDSDFRICEKNADTYYDQLTKAKKIIKEFVSWANWEGANCPNFKDIQSKAEQFLIL